MYVIPKAMIQIADAIRANLDARMLPYLDMLSALLAGESRFDLLVYCGRRSGAEQNKLFAMTRSHYEIQGHADGLRQAGFSALADYLSTFPAGDVTRPNVTNASAGESMHQYGLAIDAVPLVGGKAMWGDADFYAEYGQLSVQAGLDWAGNWTTFKEMPHSQLPGYPTSVIRAQLMPAYNPATSP